MDAVGGGAGRLVDGQEGGKDALGLLSDRLALLKERLGRTVPLSRAAILLAVAKHPEMGVRELGKRLSLAPSVVCTNLNQLAKRGLVVRRRDGDDSRGVLVVLTPKGESLIDELSGRPRVDHGPFSSFQIEAPGRFTVSRLSRHEGGHQVGHEGSHEVQTGWAG